MEIINTGVLKRLVSEQRICFEKVLPELIKRLIRNSCDDITQIRFPGGNDIWAPGFDGHVICEKGNEFVPAGESVWECGISEDYFSKIEGDYEKRTRDPGGVEPVNTSIVLVTPHVWGKKKITREEWEKEHNDWKKTLVYDGPVLCDWMKDYPAVCSWFLEQFGMRLEFRALPSAWESFSKKTEPPLSKELFSTPSWEQEGQKLISSIHSGRSIIKVKAETNVDATGFILTTLLKDPVIVDKTVVVDDHDTLRKLLPMHKNVVFVLNFFYEGECDTQDNTVIVHVNKESPMKVDFRLPARSKSEYLNGLQAMGLKSSEELYYHTKGNLRVLIRKIPGNAIDTAPDWQKEGSLRLLLPLLFVRHFNRSRDKVLIEQLGMVPYQTLEDKYLELSALEDSPVKIIDDVFSIVSYEEAWDVLNPTVDEDAFVRLTKMVKRLLDQHVESVGHSEIGYAMFPDATFGNLLDNYISFSYEDSRNSRLSAAVSEILEYINNPSTEDIIIRHLFRLAEAAPIVVLHFAREDYRAENSILRRSMTGTSYNSANSSIIHAVARLTLQPMTAIEAIKYAFQIYCDYVGSDIQNSVLNCLLNALCLWSGYGVLTTDQKTAVFRQLFKLNEQEACAFGVELLRMKSAFSGKRFGQRERFSSRQVSYEEFFHAAEQIADLVFEYACRQGEANLLEAFIERYDLFRTEKLTEYAKKLIPSAFEPSTLIYLNFKCREAQFRIIKHVPNGSMYVNALLSWINATVIQDPVYANAWMFQSVHSLPVMELLDVDISDYKRQIQRKKELRLEALKLIVSAHGMSALYRLFDVIPDEREWGDLLIRLPLGVEVVPIAESLISSKKKNMFIAVMDAMPLDQFKTVIDQIDCSTVEEMLPYINRSDHADWLKTKEQKKLYYSTKSMYAYDERTYSALLEYHPSGLVPYCNDLVELGVSRSLNQIMEVLDAIASEPNDNRTRGEEYELLEIITAVDEEINSDEWALLCWKLTRHNYLSDITDSAREYFFLHPEEMIKEYEKDDFDFSFRYSYSLPESAFHDFETFSLFFTTLIRSGHTDLAGSILGRTIQLTDCWNPHVFVCELLEEENNEELDKSVFIGHYNAYNGRLVSDGSEQKILAQSFEELGQTLTISYPHAANVMHQISDGYLRLFKEDRLYSETGKFD